MAQSMSTSSCYWAIRLQHGGAWFKTAPSKFCRRSCFPSVCAVLLLAGVADHSQIRDCHVTVFSGVFIHIVFFHLRLRVFLHPVGCGI
jgi:hypothetical protein